MSKTTSDEGIKLIKQFEGCKLTAYKCPAGVWTIGYGHTAGVKQGQKISQAQADIYLKSDLKTFENAVNSCVKVSINRYQFDALVSFAYNCGAGALKTSTLLKKLNKKDFTGASKEFSKWNKANGKVLNGLTKRRAAEAELFLKNYKETTYIPKQNITPESSEKNIRWLQEKLNKAVPSYKISVDGIFGFGTRIAVLNYWKNTGANQANATGYTVGQGTIKALSKL